MKSVILAMIGILITVYTIMIGLNVLLVQTQENQLEKHLSRIIGNVLEHEFQIGEEDAVEKMLLEELQASVSAGHGLSAELLALDLQKGIISVRMTDHIWTLTGTEHVLTVEKTVIMERSIREVPLVQVSFWVEGELYKEYEVEKGRRCPMPKEPAASEESSGTGNRFQGWMEYDVETDESLSDFLTEDDLQCVSEDRTYIAVFE